MLIPLAIIAIFIAGLVRIIYGLEALGVYVMVSGVVFPFVVSFSWNYDEKRALSRHEISLWDTGPSPGMLAGMIIIYSLLIILGALCLALAQSSSR